MLHSFVCCSLTKGPSEAGGTFFSDLVDCVALSAVHANITKRTLSGVSSSLVGQSKIFLHNK